MFESISESTNSSGTKLRDVLAREVESPLPGTTLKPVAAVARKPISAKDVFILVLEREKSDYYWYSIDGSNNFMDAPRPSLELEVLAKSFTSDVCIIFLRSSMLIQDDRF